MISDVGIDINSHNLLLSSGITNVKPLSVTCDGNCLFSSASLLISGGEHLAEELRTRCLVELICEQQFYSSAIQTPQLSQFENSHLKMTPLDSNSVFYRCSSRSNSVGVPETMALATVINSVIKYKWPAAIPCELYPTSPNFIFVPRSGDVTRSIEILLTRTVDEIPPDIWTPNHFVPLVDCISCDLDASCDTIDDCIFENHTVDHAEIFADDAYTQYCSTTSPILPVSKQCNKYEKKVNFLTSAELVQLSQSFTQCQRHPNEQPTTDSVILVQNDQQIVKRDGFKWRIYRAK